MIELVKVPNAAPTELDLRALIETFFREEFTTDNPVITEAVRRMIAAGGKRLRPSLTLFAAETQGADPREHLALAAYMELIHVATLIHDDVVDRADKRRGVNTTAVDFGNRVSVLAGDYLLAWIFKNVTASYPAPIPYILSATLAEIIDGEVDQLRSVGDLTCTASVYTETVSKKTAALFAASAECGAIAGKGSAQNVRALRDFGRAYGIAFQMADDLLDLTSNETELGKPTGNDLREHKMTLPLILALQQADQKFREELARCYHGDDSAATAERIAFLIEGIARFGGITRTREAITKYIERAKAALLPLNGTPTQFRLINLANALLT
ncbi:MAG TPA: polyprenyl synthetase family protein [Candidatus Baltobacteraceae bacterium]|nr:polyprenyl synthetase family protein [Candidatus Baltobacteraceae bacterium]